MTHIEAPYKNFIHLMFGADHRYSLLPAGATHAFRACAASLQ